MHTMCLPVVSALSDVYAGADVQAVIGLLANMGKCAIADILFRMSHLVY